MRIWLRSLRLRLLLFAFAGIALALVVAGIGLVALFNRHLERRVGQELDSHIAQLAGNVRIGDDGVASIPNEPADPRFRKVFSGLYWQVAIEPSGQLLRSASLWDADLALPVDRLTPGQTHVHDISGPDGTNLILHETRLTLNQGSVQARVSVAMDRAEIGDLSSGFARDLAPALLAFGLLLLAGAWIQVSSGLRPLLAVRRGVQDVREGRRARIEPQPHSELAPVVAEVNSLLDEQDASMRRARDRAADLAHGLKTPLTALNADIAALKSAGRTEIAQNIGALAGQMRRTVERELARSRMRNLRQGQPGVIIGPVAEGIARTLARTPTGETRDFSVKATEKPVAVDRDDIHEILGNLMENAARHARHSVAVSAVAEGSHVRISIGDDGPGIDPAQFRSLMRRGARDDESGGAAGLGLAIVSDILAAYGVEPEIGQSALGGLSVAFSLPAVISSAQP